MTRWVICRFFLAVSLCLVAVPPVSATQKDTAPRFDLTPAQAGVLKNIATRFGLTPAQARALYARVESNEALIDQLSVENGLQTQTLRAIAFELGARNLDLAPVPFVNAIRALAVDAAKAKKALAKLNVLVAMLDPGGERTEALDVLKRAKLAFDEGRLAAAEALFEKLSFLRKSELTAAFEAWIVAADIQADSAMLRGDMVSAERILRAKAAESRGRSNALLREEWRSFVKIADGYYNRGDRLGKNDDLRSAIRIYRKDALPSAPRERVPLDWAATQNNLGAALQSLGDREPGTARLDEAVVAYREALKERTRERVPLRWAATQNNLGNALQSLGDREPGTARLDEAVVAYREALKEYTRERVPLDWAMTQNNLGNALQSLGDREPGTARLDGAVLAYHEALKEYTRERVPLRWAMTQNNLGAALQSLGDREPGTARLDEAVVAFREALDVFRNASAKHSQDVTQNNLRRVKQLLRERKKQ